MLLHVCDEQEVKFIVTEAQLHSDHLLLWWRVARREHRKGWWTASLRVATGLEQPSYLLCFFFACMTVGTHIRSNTGGCRYAVSTSIEHTHSSYIYLHTQGSLRWAGNHFQESAHNSVWAELPGSWHRHRRQRHLGCIEQQESPCSPQSFGCHDELWYQLKHDLQVWAMFKVSD